jgi:hypothetical protein
VVTTFPLGYIPHFWIGSMLHDGSRESKRNSSGERISTALVESTVNQLTNWRMCQKYQMGWSRAGAQKLLHVKTAIINGRLDRYTGHYSASASSPTSSSVNRPESKFSATYDAGSQYYQVNRLSYENMIIRILSERIPDYEATDS